jgi:murein DD-endopeptidase MepM/ murein hydrolase activator NlpD
MSPASAGIVRSRPLRVGMVAFAMAVLLAPQFVAPSTAVAATVGQLRQQLAALREEAAPAGRAYDKAVTSLEDTQYRIKKTDARIKAATKKLGTAEGVLGVRADSLYREGGDLGMFEFILGAATWEDFVTRLDYITMIAASDAALIKDVKDTRVALQSDRAKLVADSKLEKKALSSASTKYKALQAQLGAKKNQYDRLMASISAQSGGTNPPGPNGMVFPVRGVHFYSNTWGAPRSGGRHHQGTDIMSPKGTPCLAVTDGVAYPHSSGLGGKSITLTGDNGWVFYYAHLNGYAINGRVRVKAGQLIGYVGNTGNASGGANHLHFQMGPHSRWVNPYSYLRGME